MKTREPPVEPLVNLSEITEIELFVLKRMRELTMGEHRSLYHGSGYDLVGLREWQAGDRLTAIDWPQSSMAGFNPMVVREFEQPGTAPVVALADRSASTRCGIDGVPIAAIVARAVATIGMSAVFFQDMFGLMTFDDGFRNISAVPPRIGKAHVMHCLTAYAQGPDALPATRPTPGARGPTPEASRLGQMIAGFLRRTSLVPVVSDFLFDDPQSILRELAHLQATHDVFLVIVDSAPAFALPRLASGWIDTRDVETGQSRVMSRSALRGLADRVRAWQDEVERLARDVDIDVLRFGIDPAQSSVSLAEFVAERRLRKV
jgi:uncharacterized protein (DUF58 family)